MCRADKELSVGLRELGVRVTKRSADLSIVLVNDYLDGQLAELNCRHLSDSAPWLLVQPSGIFPLVGPIFRPGKSACWSCLAERMRRNREVKAFLDRTKAKCVAPSPLVHDTLGQSGIQLAAVEIAKAIATDFRTELNDHIISFDLLGSTVAKHYVAVRPQCPACGSAELRDPGRTPKPIEVEAGGKLVMTSGGYRSTSPSSTVARFRKHVSPLTGVVSRLERIKADLPLNTNYFATHNYAPRPETVQELKAGLSGGSFGKGSTADQGEASALMEAIERYCSSFQGDEIRVARRFTDFEAGEALHPDDIMLIRPARPSMEETPSRPSRLTNIWRCLPHLIGRLRSNGRRSGPCAISASGTFQLAFCIFFYKGPGAESAPPADFNGCAAGNTFEEAVVQGFLEAGRTRFLCNLVV